VNANLNKNQMRMRIATCHLKICA